jgi:hypothetical protein
MKNFLFVLIFSSIITQYILANDKEKCCESLTEYANYYSKEYKDILYLIKNIQKDNYLYLRILEFVYTKILQLNLPSFLKKDLQEKRKQRFNFLSYWNQIDLINKDNIVDAKYVKLQIKEEKDINEYYRNFLLNLINKVICEICLNDD